MFDATFIMLDTTFIMFDTTIIMFDTTIIMFDTTFIMLEFAGEFAEFAEASGQLAEAQAAHATLFAGKRDEHFVIKNGIKNVVVKCSIENDKNLASETMNLYDFISQT